jgi:hypothetical protein
MIDLSQLTGFDWDESNREKNWENMEYWQVNAKKRFSTCLSCFNRM